MIVSEIQYASVVQQLPDEQQFSRWLQAALAELGRDAEVVIRVVDEVESAELNQQFRAKTGATNVLSFPVDLPDGVNIDLLGDLVVCAPVVEREAQQQQKAAHDHWAHMVVHGALHLLGYDHIDETEAEVMEAKEIAILATLKINNPYQETS